MSAIRKIPQSTYHFGYIVPNIDEEEKEIMRRLLAYGITPTGQKTIDKATLKRVELQKAKEENIVSNKFLTVSQFEQEKIQMNKKEKRKINNPEKRPNNSDKKIGAQTYGEQVFLAIKMKDTYSSQKPKFDKFEPNNSRNYPLIHTKNISYVST